MDLQYRKTKHGTTLFVKIQITVNFSSENHASSDFINDDSEYEKFKWIKIGSKHIYDATENKPIHKNGPMVELQQFSIAYKVLCKLIASC